MEGEASSRSERHAVVMKDTSWLAQFKNASNPWMARYMYGIIFLLSNLIAWALRDYGDHDSLKGIHKWKVCAVKTHCFGTEGVLRVSLGCFLFFIVMLISTAGTSSSKDPRDLWHSGWWIPKILLWACLTMLTFLAPSSVILSYGEVAHVGAGMFLIVQLISMINFITWLNDWCRVEKNAERCHINVMVTATILYIISGVGIILMYIWYSSSILNIFFITCTLVLLQLMTSVSLHPKVNAGILAPGLMGFYVVYLCWCAIRSEPALDSSKGVSSDWFTITSFVIALMAIVIATFSTGIDSDCFQVRRESETGDGVPYNYAFFHFVFAAGGMYFAMLMIGWAGKHSSIKKWTMDVGWTSAWVRIVNEWFAVCVYLWMVLTPIILEARPMTEHDEEHEQV